jgi:hypothetical protein
MGGAAACVYNTLKYLKMPNQWANANSTCIYLRMYVSCVHTYVYIHTYIHIYIHIYNPFADGDIGTRV